MGGWKGERVTTVTWRALGEGFQVGALRDLCPPTPSNPTHWWVFLWSP